MKMKIRVLVDDYEYMGLMKGSVHDAFVCTNARGEAEYHFALNGKRWTLYSSYADPVPQECSSPYCECEGGKCHGGRVDTLVKEQGPIKSDGGSSSYYDLNVPAWLLYTLNERQKEGRCYIKTEEIISAFFGNDFDRANIIKSLVRCQGLQEGTGGKAGNSVDYECNKMIYSVNKIKEKK